MEETVLMNFSYNEAEFSKENPSNTDDVYAMNVMTVLTTTCP
jgi:hypothetical protein